MMNEVTLQEGNFMVPSGVFSAEMTYLGTFQLRKKNGAQSSGTVCPQQPPSQAYQFTPGFCPHLSF
jgi:hypothetical protein